MTSPNLSLRHSPSPSHVSPSASSVSARPATPVPEESLPFGGKGSPVLVESPGASKHVSRGTVHATVTVEALRHIPVDSREANLVRAGFRSLRIDPDGFSMVEANVLFYQFLLAENGREHWFSAIATLAPDLGRINALRFEQQRGGHEGNVSDLLRVELDLGSPQVAGRKRSLSPTQQALVDQARRRHRSSGLASEQTLEAPASASGVHPATGSAAMPALEDADRSVMADPGPGNDWLADYLDLRDDWVEDYKRQFEEPRPGFTPQGSACENQGRDDDESSDLFVMQTDDPQAGAPTPAGQEEDTTAAMSERRRGKMPEQPGGGSSAQAERPGPAESGSATGRARALNPQEPGAARPERAVDEQAPSSVPTQITASGAAPSALHPEASTHAGRGTDAAAAMSERRQGKMPEQPGGGSSGQAGPSALAGTGSATHHRRALRPLQSAPTRPALAGASGGSSVSQSVGAQRPGSLMNPVPAGSATSYSDRSADVLYWRQRVTELSCKDAKTVLNAWLDVNADKCPSFIKSGFSVLKAVDKKAVGESMTVKAWLESVIGPVLASVPGEARAMACHNALANALAQARKSMGAFNPWLKILTGVDLSWTNSYTIPEQTGPCPFPDNDDFAVHRVRYFRLSTENRDLIRTFYDKRESLPSSFGLNETRNLMERLHSAMLLVEGLQHRPEIPGQPVEKAAVPWLRSLIARGLRTTVDNLPDLNNLTPAENSAIYKEFKTQCAALKFPHAVMQFFPFVMALTGVDLSNRG